MHTDDYITVTMTIPYRQPEELPLRDHSAIYILACFDQDDELSQTNVYDNLADAHAFQASWENLLGPTVLQVAIWTEDGGWNCK